MVKAIITFANGEKITIVEDGYIFPITSYVKDGKALTSMDKPYQLWAHTHDGLIPSATELLSSCAYFGTDKSNGKIYSSSAVVSIENL